MICFLLMLLWKGEMIMHACIEFIVEAAAAKSQRSKANAMNTQQFKEIMMICVAYVCVCKSLKMHVLRLLQCIWKR